MIDHHMQLIHFVAIAKNDGNFRVKTSFCWNNSSVNDYVNYATEKLKSFTNVSALSTSLHDYCSFCEETTTVTHLTLLFLLILYVRYGRQTTEPSLNGMTENGA
jgi:hypothetical protein